MTKILVETTGSFMLMNPQTGEEIPNDRPAVVRNSNFVSQRAGVDQIKILATSLPDEASDQEFQAYWSEDPEIAVEAFLSQYSEEASENTDTQAPDPKPSQRRSTSKSKAKAKPKTEAADTETADTKE